MSSAASSSCSHWWHAPIYIAATDSLIFAAISSSSHDQESREDQGGDLILALHLSGFHLTAHHLLHYSLPSLHLSSPFTLFALPDSFLSDSDAELLLLRHVIPLHRLPFSSLPPNASFPTLLPSLNLSFDPSLVSRPNLFVCGPQVVHDLSRPFPLPLLLNWDPALRALRSKGYASFSRSLSATAEAVLECSKHHQTKINVTVFAAREWEEGEAGHDVRRHVALGRYGYGEVREMEIGEVMRSLCGEIDDDHNIRVTDHNGVMEVNGVEIVEPEVYADDRIVVHGIATAFVSWSGDDDSFFI